MENLRYFLSSEDPSEPVFFGHHFTVIVQPQVSDQVQVQKSFNTVCHLYVTSVSIQRNKVH